MKSKILLDIQKLCLSVNQWVCVGHCSRVGITSESVQLQIQGRHSKFNSNTIFPKHIFIVNNIKTLVLNCYTSFQIYSQNLIIFIKSPICRVLFICRFQFNIGLIFCTPSCKNQNKLDQPLRKRQYQYLVGTPKSDLILISCEFQRQKRLYRETNYSPTTPDNDCNRVGSYFKDLDFKLTFVDCGLWVLGKF